MTQFVERDAREMGTLFQSAQEVTSQGDSLYRKHKHDFDRYMFTLSDHWSLLDRDVFDVSNISVVSTV